MIANCIRSYLGVALVLHTTLCAAQDPATVGSVAANEYAFRLFHQFCKATEGNFCFSPYSSHQVAAMLVDGAAGATKDELSGLTFLPKEEANRLPLITALRAQLDQAVASGHLQLGIANSIRTPRQMPFLPAFETAAKRSFGAHVGHVPSDNPVSAAAIVNAWVKERTKGKITNLVGPSMFPTEAPVAVLVNAVYLKAGWRKPFDATKTKKLPFNLPDQSRTMLPTMAAVEGWLYAEAEGWQSVEIPFQSEAMSFCILLPRDAAARGKVESNLSDENCAAMLAGMTEAEVTSFIPRFNYSTELSMKSMWRTLGAKTAFMDGKADFSKMIRTPCFLSDVVHHATIEINEVGAEATAATVAIAEPFGAMPGSPKKRKVVFRADKPFLWFITHRPTGLIVFMGRFAGK